MNSDIIKLSSVRMSFQELLKLIDDAIGSSKPIQISKKTYNQKNNNIILLIWLQKYKIIELFIEEKIIPKKPSTRSRKRKIEISLQLKSLGINDTEISKKFRVKTQTVKNYFKDIGKYDNNYITILKTILGIKNITTKTDLNDLPTFPIRESFNNIKEKIDTSSYKNLEKLAKDNKNIKVIAGQNLGTSSLSILFPQK